MCLFQYHFMDKIYSYKYNIAIPSDLRTDGLTQGSRKKGFLLVARPLREGGGVRAWPLRKKTLFEALKNIRKNIVAAKKYLFLRLRSYRQTKWLIKTATLFNNFLFNQDKFLNTLIYVIIRNNKKKKS